jgi:purine nucleoside permease
MLTKQGTVFRKMIYARFFHRFAIYAVTIRNVVVLGKMYSLTAMGWVAELEKTENILFHGLRASNLNKC